MSQTIFGLIEAGGDPDEVVEILIAGCVLLNIYNEPVCRGAIEAYWPPLVYMHENTEGFGPQRFCGLLVGGECGEAEQLNDWAIEVPQGKPPVEEPTMPEVSS